MTVDPSFALAEVEELLLGPEGIPVQLRARQGLNPDQYTRLITAIKVLIDVYKERADVPKRLALAFVDISNYFYFTEDYYGRDELERLEDAAHELTYLADQLFS